MQIFSKLHMFFSSLGNPVKIQKGFTLIELLISIGIIAILTGLVLVRYGSFDSTTLLKSAAYEVGLNIREAQVRSVSASRGGTGFDRPFGISFDISDTGNRNSYILFFNEQDDENKDPTNFPPFYDTVDVDEEVLTFQVVEPIEINDLCIGEGINEECGLDTLDISFKRPEYRAYMYATRDSDSSEYSNEASAKIKLHSKRGDQDREFTVTVSQLGQINVDLETP